ncbi:putative Tripartite ATP-independent periplasmic transporter DctQ component [Desulfamplus magnetovallimortis]|uniref:Putative Tripartite ATP-independent periplasmic transporter DctQ component n=1 Tax=Desulfamplus magnetovallimortis TaxID=1246637 RepID=A0A1W1HG72_9BACT|nr:TRAP transporter small permease subunit [Desulfamplus magnetovallimortis]SLM31388.1 putative Tripartite ATP-independent periplasmic transporter DctQ component [Desulfamplus magnetovallimortis]
MLEPLSQTIENISRKEGEVTSFLIYPLLFIVIYEVFMRYAFNAPTTWGFEATTFLYGLHYMFGFAYTDVQDGHVKVDIFTSLLSEKKQIFIKIFTNIVMFMPVMFCMTLWAFKFAYTSTMGLEVNSTSWAPPIWPIKILMGICFLFLFLQGVANLINDINALKQK